MKWMTTPPCCRCSCVKKSPGKSSIEGRTQSGLPSLSCSKRRLGAKGCPSSARAPSDEACCRWKNATWTITNTGTSHRSRRRLLLIRGKAAARLEGREKGDTADLRVTTLIVSGMVSSRPCAASASSSCPGDDALSGASMRCDPHSPRIAVLTRLLYLSKSQAARSKPGTRLRSTPVPDAIGQRTLVRHRLG